jgi:hypothetical protein
VTCSWRGSPTGRPALELAPRRAVPLCTPRAPKTRRYARAPTTHSSPGRDRAVSHGPPATSLPCRIVDSGAHPATGVGLIVYSFACRMCRTCRMRWAPGVLARPVRSSRRVVMIPATHPGSPETHSQRIACARATAASPYGRTDCKFTQRMQRTQRIRWATLSTTQFAGRGGGPTIFSKRIHVSRVAVRKNGCCSQKPFPPEATRP